MNYRIEHTPGAIVISLTVKDLAPRRARKGLQKVVRDLPYKEAIVVDLGELVTLGPAGIGLLVSWISDARARRQQLSVSVANRSVLAIMDLVRMQSIVPVFASRLEAIRAAQKPSVRSAVEEIPMAVAASAS